MIAIVTAVFEKNFPVAYRRFLDAATNPINFGDADDTVVEPLQCFLYHYRYQLVVTNGKMYGIPVREEDYCIDWSWAFSTNK
jgi:hypothetical protein